MFNKYRNLVVIIPVFDFDALRISVPPLRKLNRNFTLVIYNDNPGKSISRRDIRRLGWHGPLHIVNADKNYGEFESCINAIDYVRNSNIKTDWVLFLDSCDILIDSVIPDVPKNVFAIVQNATTLSDTITDIFKINDTWVNGTEYGITGTHFNMAGTIVRIPVMIEYITLLKDNLEKLCKILCRGKYCIPINAAMWTGLNAFMRIAHPDMSPIYMNRTNCVAIKMGHASVKYGRRMPIDTTAQKVVSDTVNRFVKAVEKLAIQNTVAENQ